MPSPTRRAERIVIVALGYLAAGAAISFLVAAGCVMWMPLALSSGPSRTLGLAGWGELSYGNKYSSYPAAEFLPTILELEDVLNPPWREQMRAGQPLRISEDLLTGISLGLEADRLVVFEEHGASVVERVRAGWPLRCVCGHVMTTEPSWSKGGPSLVGGPSNPPWDSPRPLHTEEGAFPYRVEPRGLAADSAFWGATVWLIGRGMALLRRASRRRRGRCGRCGYSVAGLNGPTSCPECGAPLKTSASTQSAARAG